MFTKETLWLCVCLGHSHKALNIFLCRLFLHVIKTPLFEWQCFIKILKRTRSQVSHTNALWSDNCDRRLCNCNRPFLAVNETVIWRRGFHLFSHQKCRKVSSSTLQSRLRTEEMVLCYCWALTAIIPSLKYIRSLIISQPCHI